MIEQRSTEHEETDPVFLQTQMEEILRDAQQLASLIGVVLTTPEGLELAGVAADVAADASPELLAGLSSLFSDAAARATTLLQWPDVDEVSLVNERGVRLVTRQFVEQNETFLLVVMVPSHQTYRRATNQAIRRLRPLVSRSRTPAA